MGVQESLIEKTYHWQYALAYFKWMSALVNVAQIWKNLWWAKCSSLFWKNICAINLKNFSLTKHSSFFERTSALVNAAKSEKTCQSQNNLDYFERTSALVNAAKSEKTCQSQNDLDYFEWMSALVKVTRIWEELAIDKMLELI